QRGAGRELRHSRRLDVNGLAGRWVATLSRTAVRHAELAESGEDDVTSTPERALDGFQHRVHRTSGVLFAQPGAICNLVDELGLRHFLLLRGGRNVRS